MSLSIDTSGLQSNAPLLPSTFQQVCGPRTVDFVFRDAQLIFESGGTDVYRGKLFRPFNDVNQGADVVCKIAYSSRAVCCIDNEAKMYTTKLQHLQGVCIPLCYGYFANRDDTQRISCLVLEYCGEPIKKSFPDLDVDFKQALVYAAILLHDAGVKHGNWDEENVLDYNGLPMIIDLETAQPHKCERRQDIIEGAGALAPQLQEFGCNELYQLCDDLKYWKPGMINFALGYVPIIEGMNAEDLAATLPKMIPREVALKRAKLAIRQHVKVYYPNNYDEWRRSKHRSSGSSVKTTSSRSSKSSSSRSSKSSSSRSSKTRKSERDKTSSSMESIASSSASGASR